MMGEAHLRPGVFRFFSIYLEGTKLQVCQEANRE
jgi:hypothetical protein